MTGIYQSIDTTNDNQAFTVLSAGYTFTGGNPTTVPGLLSAVGTWQVAVITFVDAAAGSTGNDAAWLKDAAAADSLTWLYGHVDTSKVLIAAILYQSPVAGTNPYGNLGPAACTPFFSGSAAYFKAYNAWYVTNGTNIAGPAAHFHDGIIDATIPPFTYVIWRSSKVIADKIQRGCRYSGESTYTPKADMLRLDWDTTNATNATMYDYLYKRLTIDHANTPSVTVVKPSALDNLLGATTPKVTNGSRFRLSFSEKVVGAATPAKFVFNDGSADVSNAVSPITDYDVGWAAYTAATPTQTEPDLERTLANLAAENGKTLTLKSASPGLLDTTGIGFTSAASFAVDTAGDPAGYPGVKIIVKDGGTSYDISTGGIPPALANPTTRSLTVQVITGYPTPVQPTGRVIKQPTTGAPTTIPLNFTNYAATIDQTQIDVEGVYTVVVDPFTNNAGQAIPETVRRFVVALNISAHTNAKTIEGWGYYPREELAPANAAETTAAVPGVGAWTSDGGAGTVTTPVLGSRLEIKANSSWTSFSRVYANLFGTAADSLPGSGISYVEAGFGIPTYTPGTAKSVYDQNGGALSLYVLGVGLEIWNGPFKLSLMVVDTGTDIRLAAHVYHPSQERYQLCSSMTLSLANSYVVRAQFDPTAPGSYRIYCAVLGTALGATPAMTVNLDALLSDATALYTSGVRFGILSVANQSPTCQWEFVRYGYLDPAYLPLLNTTSQIGIVHTQRAGETAYYRSSDLLINGSGTADPNPDAANQVAAVLFSATPAPALASQIPYKVRFFVVDWDQGAPTVDETSIAGFSKGGFLPCYQTSTAPGFTAMGPGPAAVAGKLAAGTASYTAASVQWQFNLLRDRRARRLFLLAYVDSPLFPAPALLPSVATATLLVDDGAAKSDFRCAVRQFLPDYFVRDYFGDDGTSVLGGWLSPDVAMATFLGTAGITPNTAHALRTPAPDPRAVDTTNNSYPIGFARGEPYASSLPADFPYTPAGSIDMSATGGSATTVKVSDNGYSDVGSQCYFNRMWVRISNRGVVPGPAKVQVFFLGAQMRATFDPTTARDGAYQKICSRYDPMNSGSWTYIQDVFQHYKDDGTIELVSAVPALSGAVTPGVTAAVHQNFVIAEFLWHVFQGDVPTDPNQAHSCRALCINLPRPAGTYTGSTETWSSGVDEAPAITTPTDIWSVNKASNNIGVRNSNIVVGSTPPYNLRMLIVNLEPQNFQKLPNDFVQTFADKPATWGLEVDAGAFPGELVLRVAASASKNATPQNMEEITPAPEQFRYFLVTSGTVGKLVGITPRKQGDPDAAVRVFFQPSAQAKPNVYAVTVAQTADGKRVGGYQTGISVVAPAQIRYVADTRTKIVYDAKKYPPALAAIPFENRPAYLGPGAALREGYRLGPTDTVALLTGALKNEEVNVPRGHKFLKRAQILHQDMTVAVVGRVVAGNVKPPANNGVANIRVALEIDGKPIGSGLSDELGRYLITVKADAKEVPIKSVPGKVELVALDPKTNKELFRRTDKVDELCFAAKDLPVPQLGPKR